MTLVAGIDSSTQSCKVLICDAGTGEVVRDGRATPHQGALLMELQQDVGRRAHKRGRGSLVAQFFVAVGAFVLAYFSRRPS